jgi:hypothetical protein
LLGLILARVTRGNIRQVNRKDIGNQNFSGMTAAGAAWLVLVGEVLTKGTLGARAIFCKAARADFARSISNDPDRPLSERTIRVPVFGPKPEASALPWTRHAALISSIAASVV